MAISFIDFTQIPYVATFLLVFAIVFGLLSSMRREKRDKQGKVTETSAFFDRKVNAILGLVFGFFAASYEPLVTNLQEFMPYIAMLLIGVFFIIFVKKLFGHDKDNKDSDYLPIIVTIVILLIVLMGIGYDLFDFVPIAVDRSQVLWIGGIVLIVLIFYAAYQHGREKK